MPNWCYNEVSISFNEESIASEFADNFRKKGFASDFPMPEELSGTTSPERVVSSIEYENLSDSDKEFYVTEEKAKHLKEKYGYSNWYDWCAGNWGVKWNVEPDTVEVDGLHVDLYFETAWSPPIVWAKKISEKYKCFVAIHSLEPGCDFCYVAEFSNGELTLEQQDSYYSRLSFDIFGVDHFVEDMDWIIDDVFYGVDCMSDDDKSFVINEVLIELHKKSESEIIDILRLNNRGKLIIAEEARKVKEKYQKREIK